MRGASELSEVGGGSTLGRKRGGIRGILLGISILRSFYAFAAIYGLVVTEREGLPGSLQCGGEFDPFLFSGLLKSGPLGLLLLLFLSFRLGKSDWLELGDEFGQRISLRDQLGVYLGDGQFARCGLGL